jgi:hypothetical protein
MTIAWTGFPAPAALTSSDVFVGLAGGTVNARYLGSSVLLSAQNLNDLPNKATARTNLGVSITKGAGTGSSIGGASSLAAGSYAFAYGNTSLAAGDYAFAFGNGSSAPVNYAWAIGNGAIVTNAGSVVWGDSNATPTTDSAANQFNLSFANGYRFFDGSFNVSTVGKGLAVKEGSNAKQGVVTLVSGVGVVSNTAVTANSRIFYCGQDTNVTGILHITARTTGSGFTITSSVSGDTGVVAYEIFEPAV